MTRIDAKFAELSAAGKKAFVSYVMAGDPDYATSLEIVCGLQIAEYKIILQPEDNHNEDPKQY